MNRCQRLLAALTLASCLVAPANAAVYLFKYTGDASVSWRLPSRPIPSYHHSFLFQIEDVATMSNGVSSSGKINFYKSSFHGGFYLYSPLIVGGAQQLFTGTTEFPTFKLGTFTTVGRVVSPGNGTLTISLVPESTTWAMLIAGLGLTGAAMRRRRSATLVA